MPRPFSLCVLVATCCVLWMSAPANAGALCTSNQDCGAMEFCNKTDGDCAGDGICAEVPAACPVIFDPVCGCDGADYDNWCYANQAETSVAYAGSCQPACQSDADCGQLEYCDTAHNGCGMPGACRIQPDLCAPDFDPVCGCDETTYDNACFSAMFGVSVVRVGECGLCPFESGTDCIFSDRFESATTARWSATVDN